MGENAFLLSYGNWLKCYGGRMYETCNPQTLRPLWQFQPDWILYKESQSVGKI